jgi:hypothetical protein
MSDHDADKPEFRNPATRERRAWIDRALASVRDSLREGDRPPVDEHDPTAGTSAVAEAPRAPRPRLAVVPGSRRGV